MLGALVVFGLMFLETKKRKPPFKNLNPRNWSAAQTDRYLDQAKNITTHTVNRRVSLIEQYENNLQRRKNLTWPVLDIMITNTFKESAYNEQRQKQVWNSSLRFYFQTLYQIKNLLKMVGK